MKSQPSVDILQKSIIDAQSSMPLHAQVRRALQQAVEEHFVDGQKFWTEAVLIEKLKVSQVTVRRALSDLSSEGVLHRQVAKGTFVRKGVPQAAAQNTLFSIGVFLPEWDSPVLASTLEQLNEICWEEKLRLQVFHTRKGQKVSDAFHMVDFSPQEGGAILYGTMQQATCELYEALEMRGYRTVNIDACMKDYPGAYIGVDNALGIEMGMQHLMELGHRRITLMVNEPEENSSIAARMQAFETLCDKHGLESTLFHCGTKSFESSYENAYRKMPELWDAKPHPTAIFAVSDSGALAAMRWFAERGIRVPHDVSLLGFDDDPASSIVHPGLSTFARPVAEIARHAVAMLTQTAQSPRAMSLAPRLIVRGSTAAPAIARGGKKKEVRPNKMHKEAVLAR